jgi:hypothetical protein
MMLLPDMIPSGLRSSPDKPIVAILTIDDDIQLFRGNRQNFVDLIRTGENLGFITFVVTVRNLKLGQPRVLGYTFRQEDDSWVKAWFPAPSVIYNRIPQREDEKLPHVKRKLTLLSKQPGIRLFNRRFFNKWSLFKWLNHSRTTRKYIPDTKRLTEPKVLGSLLKRHHLLYLKPVSGKAGVGIMTVKVQPEKQLPYRLQIQEERGSRTLRCSTLARLWEKVQEETYTEGGKETYIAQQGIQLASVNSRPFDLRVLVQKNMSGVWDLTGIGARVAGDSSITTHVPRGGYIDEPEKLLIQVFGIDKASRVRACHYRLAEMSMDLGVDEGGNVWFFEANSKPMKFDEPHIRNKSLERIFQYSQYLHRTRAGKPLLKGGVTP